VYFVIVQQHQPLVLPGVLNITESQVPVSEQRNLYQIFSFSVFLVLECQQKTTFSFSSRRKANTQFIHPQDSLQHKYHPNMIKCHSLSQEVIF